MPLQLAPTPAALPGPDWLADAEKNPPWIPVDAPLTAAIEAFETSIDLRLMPVVDAHRRPVGAVMERDIRRLLLNPFGHALMRNPAYGRSLAGYIRPCPIAEASLGIGALMKAYRSANGSEGMVLTHDGKLHAVIANRRLVYLSAAREAEEIGARLERAHRIERATQRFEAGIAELVAGVGDVASVVGRHADETATRSNLATNRASAVAAAAGQTSHSMAAIADEGRALAYALSSIGQSTIDAKAAAEATVELMTAGSARAADLQRSARTVEAVIALIGEIARKVNLLALNATIEAARAGEAGRGFTVVANEVKLLSMQTGAAAATITGHVREMCGAIEEVTDGHNAVEQAIAAINGLSHEIESAVGTQAFATEAIARHVDEVLHASEEIRSDVEAIGGTARSAASSASDLGSYAHMLLGGANRLKAEVDAFLEEVRAA